MSQMEDGQVERTSTISLSLLPQRIEFHLSRKSSLSFSGSSLKHQNAFVSESSGPLHSNFEDDMDSDFKSHVVVRRIGAGLENLGNTCFLNSVLQCLTYTKPLVAYLQSGKHHSSCRVVGFCSLCAMQKHITRTLQATGKVLAPKDLVSNLRGISRNFRNGRQEDAHEYMVHLLVSMHKCCLPSGVPSESSGAYERSFVHKIFGGCLRSQVKCMQCSYCSDKFDPFVDLSLEIVNADSLQKALMHFTAQEQLDAGEKRYQCQQCKQKVRALKQLTIDKAPYVLTIHLKRFGSHKSGQKIDKKVQFGPTLNIKPFVSGSYDGDLNYTLYGVLVHAGWSTHSGHYYCFVRTSSGMWYTLDDSRVHQVSERTVMEQKAYMLFYMRDDKSSTPKSTVNAIQKDKIVPKSSTSQTLESKSTDRPANALKAIPSAITNQTGVTSATCQWSQEKSADKPVTSAQKDKIMTSVMQNGSSATQSVSPGFLEAGRALEGPDPEKKPDNKSGNAFSIPSRQKLKKKVLTCRVASAHLSRRMFYEASFNMQKRKKPKKGKRSSQQPVAMSIVDEPVGPPTSHVTSAITIRGSSSPTKGSKGGVRKRGTESTEDAKNDVISSEISITENSASELKQRTAAGDTVVSVDDQLLKSPKMPDSLKHQQHIRPSNLNVKINFGNDVAVAHWDDIELQSSHTADANKTKTISIGYVPDEWDEEYDRGKRKKIRMSKISFGGPNPFQEVATRAAKKNEKSKRSNHASQPF